MRRFTFRIFLFIPIIFLIHFNSKAQKATPDAIGFGSVSRGAYAGSDTPRLLIVDNLEDNASGNEDTGKGTLRWALTREYPRIIIFEISGYINLTKPLYINSPFVTIAGQTAPSPGVTLRYYDLIINTKEVILQHIRCRLGDLYAKENDAAGIYSGPNIFVDHCSFSWGTDEIFSLSSTDAIKNVTISNCIISEGLNYKEHGFGTLIYYGDSIYFVNNLFAHLQERAPLIGGGAKNVMIVNNLIYNVALHHIYIGWDRFDESDFYVSIIGNKLISGVNTKENRIIYISDHKKYGHVYLKDNLSSAYNGNPLSVVEFKNIQNIVDSQTLSFDGYKPATAQSIEKRILKNVGARPLDRDPVDLRIISDVKNRTGKIIDSQLNVGGYPHLDSNRIKHVLPERPHEKGEISNYTNLEIWLYSFHLDLLAHNPY